MILRRFILLVLTIHLLLGNCMAFGTASVHTPTDKVPELIAAIQSSYDGEKTSILMNELLFEYEKRFTKRSPQYAECLLWCARICVDKGDNSQGYKLMKQSEMLFSECGTGVFEGRDTLPQIFYLDLQAKIYSGDNNTYRALRYMRDANNLKQSFFGNESETYLMSLLETSHIYATRLNYGRSNYYHNLAYTSYVCRLKQEFCSISESKRVTYWSKAARYIDRTLVLAYETTGRGEMRNENDLASAAYNAILLSKSLLLNTTLSFEEHIYSTNNLEAIELLHTKKLYREQHKDLSTIDSLDYKIIDVLKASGQDFDLPNLYIGWTDVAERLNDDDLAVEFYVTSKGQYGAILLKKGWKSPRLVKLKQNVSVEKKTINLTRALETLQLDGYTTAQARDFWNLSRAIWVDDIIVHFPQTSSGRVFFSADGMLLTTAIENLPFIEPNDEEYYTITDAYTTFRLSSTRELAIEKPHIPTRNTAIYGGLRYNMQYDKLVDDARKEINRRRGITDSLLLRGSEISYLKGSLIEADSIINIFSSRSESQIEVKPYLDTLGTEASFKALSGRGINHIHIATHGFFSNANDQSYTRLKLGDDPLNRSALLFSGATHKWSGDDIPVDVDDGILTALEISTLDFRGLDLIVLSACETGRGIIDSDGVFGLQRGFKMAGVNSIIMSLWKVNDDATCQLMIEFYKNWIIYGCPKYVALEKAKMSIRMRRDKSWDNPYFWAGFILLDGVDAVI